jgi:hypothetical protein
VYCGVRLVQVLSKARDGEEKTSIRSSPVTHNMSTIINDRPDKNVFKNKL